jgi:hypothetical protein
MAKAEENEKINVTRDEYEFLKAVVEAVDDYLNAPFPRLREESLEWLTDTLGDDLGDEDPKLRQARLDDADCDECRKLLNEAFAWKARQRRVEPAPVLTLHRHGDKLN